MILTSFDRWFHAPHAYFYLKWEKHGFIYEENVTNYLTFLIRLLNKDQWSLKINIQRLKILLSVLVFIVLSTWMRSTDTDKRGQKCAFLLTSPTLSLSVIALTWIDSDRKTSLILWFYDSTWICTIYLHAKNRY